MSNRRTTYRVIQKGEHLNEDVINFSGLVTHHPEANRAARMLNGTPSDTEDLKPNYKGRDRSYAFIGGEIQEVELRETDTSMSLKPNQVLLKKDFILENSDHPYMGTAARNVDVPSPVAGYVGRVDESQGLVDIYDQKGGDVIARVRHMRDISSSIFVGETVEYGQTLGTQSDVRTKRKHVHLEMDTRYYQQFENYVSDLVSGRLSVQAEHRRGIQPLPVVDDGVVRLGESGERVFVVQRALVADGYRSVGDKPIQIDGVYRLDAQGAVLAFQQDHRLLQTGDIDSATYQLALRVSLDKQLGPVEKPVGLEAVLLPRDAFFQELHDIERGLDPAYTLRPEHAQFCYPPDPARTGRAPQYHDHPDHPDHRPNLPRALEPAINQRRNRQSFNQDDRDADSRGPFNDPYLDRAYAAAISGNNAELDRIGLEFNQSQEGQRMLQWGQELFAQQQFEQQRQAQEQRMTQERQGPVMTR